MTVPHEVAEAPRAAGFGKFVRTAKLGAGGMGEVWKAWDTELSRWIALKFLKGEDDDELARFKREAQTAGRLNHPSIAAIYEVGQAQDRHYIAMQFVEGQTLKTFPRGDKKLLVRLMRDATLAVQFAHEQGVIHRDLKPENLMVVTRSKPGTARAEKGKPVESHHVYVMDFGLARQTQGASDLSVSGQIVGTPSFMSPEQSRGEKVDVRADVYSLGATLYGLLTDRAPFKGLTVYETLKKVQEEEPRPPRKIDPKIDVDLETIVLKCLEKDPARRYATASDLAGDLDRWLEGEPIAARPASIVYKLRKRLAKRKAVVAMSVVAASGLAAVLVVLGTLLPALSRKESQLSEAQRLAIDQMRKTSSASLKAALALRKAGDLEEMRRLVPQVREACQEVKEKIPNLAEPYQRLGRMYRALMEFDKALKEQEEALRRDPHYGPALYEHAVLATRLYNRRCAALLTDEAHRVGLELARTGGGEIRGTRRFEVSPGRELALHDAEARRLSEQIEKDVAALETAEGEPEAGALECARGHRACVRGDMAEAKRLLEAAIARQSGLDEAYEIRAMLEMDQERLDAAVEWWSRGAASDRGYVPFLLGRAEARHVWANSQHRRGEDGTENYRLAIEEDLARAIALSPADAETWRLRGATRVDWGSFRSDRGQDPTEHYRRAIEEDFRKAIELNPGDATTWRYRGNAHVNWADHQRAHGQDPTENYGLAMEDFTRAIDLHPGEAHAWGQRGATRVNRGVYRKSRGEDPTADYRRAIDEDFRKAIELNPGDATVWGHRGTARVHWGVHQEAVGEDPTENYERAIEEFTKAIELDPRSAFERAGRAGARVELAGHEMSHGGDPSEHYRRAMEDVAKAIELSPADGMLRLRRGWIRNSWAGFQGNHGEDPTENYRRAIEEDFAKAIEIDGTDAKAHTERGGARCNWARHQETHGEDPTENYRRAIDEDLARAVKLDPASADAWKFRGHARSSWAYYQRGRGEDPTENYGKAIEDYSKAIEAKPGEAEVWISRGGVRVDLAVELEKAGQDPLENYRWAIEEDFAKAIKLSPRDATVWLYRGNARYNSCLYQAKRQQDWKENCRGAVADYTRACELNPSLHGRLDGLIEGCRRALGKE